MNKIWVWVGFPVGIGVVLLLLVFMGGDSGAREGLEYMTVESEDGQPIKMGFIDMKVGKGRPAKKGDVAAVFFTFKFKSGKEFNNKGKQPMPVQVGMSMGPKGFGPGFENGVIGMKKGGVRQLIVPPALAFGVEGIPEHGIPPNAEALIEIELAQLQQ